MYVHYKLLKEGKKNRTYIIKSTVIDAKYQGLVTRRAKDSGELVVGAGRGGDRKGWGGHGGMATRVRRREDWAGGDGAAACPLRPGEEVVLRPCASRDRRK